MNPLDGSTMTFVNSATTTEYLHYSYKYFKNRYYNKYKYASALYTNAHHYNIINVRQLQLIYFYACNRHIYNKILYFLSTHKYTFEEIIAKIHSAL